MKHSKNMKKTLTLGLVLILIAASTMLVAQAKLSIGTPLSVKPEDFKPSTELQPICPQLELAIPSSMAEGREFVVGVYIVRDNRTIPIPNARVFWLNGTYTTDSTGRVTLTAPQVDSDTVFEISAAKRGYKSAVDHILITDSDLPQLMLAIPEFMTEGREFVVGVYILDGNETVPISNASVFWLNGTYITDASGRVTLVAPFVHHNSTFTIIASKRGYHDAIGQIGIIDQLLQLQLILPSEINENIQFTAFVQDIGGMPVEGVLVGFQSGDMYFGGGFTGHNGTVVCTAPEVNQTTIYTMGALKSGYISDFSQITVFDTNESIEGFGWIYGLVLEAGTLLPLQDANVYLMRPDGTYVIIPCGDGITDAEGHYSIQVWSGIYNVIAYKEGYDAVTVTGINVSAFTAVEVNFALSRIEFLPPSIVYVDDDFNENTTGWSYDHFNTVQAGINAVVPGGSVFVYSGIYYENILIDKPLILDGQNKDTVIIDGNHADDVIMVTTVNNVLIDDLTIKNSGTNTAGILIDHASSVSVTNVQVSDCTWGITLEFASYCTIGDSVIQDCSQIGILLEYSNSNILVHNTLSNNGLTGIHLVHSVYGNSIFHNNLINNGQQAFSSGPNIWNESYPSGGNYWSDYTGVDENGDGIGDTPYSIPGPGGNQDMYPLMQPCS